MNGKPHAWPVGERFQFPLINFLPLRVAAQETGLKSFTGDEVLRMQKSGKTVIVDVRPR